MIGGLQTQEALKLIHGIPAAEGQALIYNGAANRFYSTAFQLREDCLSHESYPDPIELPAAAERDTVAQLFDMVRNRAGKKGPFRLALDRDLVVSLTCARCDVQRSVMKPRHLVGVAEADCPQCGEPTRARIEHVIAAESDLANEKLFTLGVPRYDIVRVATGGGEQPVLLADDREAVMG